MNMTHRATLLSVAAFLSVVLVMAACGNAAEVPDPTLTITVTSTAPAVLRHETAQLSAVVRNSKNEIVPGSSITWESKDSMRARINETGMITGRNAGPVALVAHVGAYSGQMSVTINELPAPEPAVTDVVIWQDQFERPSSSIGTGYARRGTMISVADGHVGGGIRFPYTAESWDNLIERGWTPTKDIYFRYWYRTSAGADPTCKGKGESGMKWFMAWRPDPLPRYTFGVGNLTTGVGGQAGPQSGLEFVDHDNSSPEPTGFLQNIVKTPKFGTTNDGNWHKYTLHIVTDDGSGQGTGYEQMWVDGTLVIDTFEYKYHHETTGVGAFQFPGTMVQWFAGCDFIIDVDDLVVWHR